MNTDHKLAVSIATSWAWGTSLILGMQIAQEKGIGAFWIWAIANTLTLAIFGYAYRKRLLNPKVLDNKFVKAVMLVIQCFCLLIQFKILHQCMLPHLGSAIAMGATCGMGLILTFWMFKKGLGASIHTDCYQGTFAVVSLLACIGLSLYGGIEYVPSPTSNSDSIMWALWSAVILLSGIMTDVQHWQRAEVNKGYAFEYASVLFFGYLMLVLTLSHYQLQGMTSAIIMFAVIGVTTSTIDSVVVGAHRLTNRNIGTVLCGAICCTWWVFVNYGVLDLWSYFGVIRVALASFIIYLSVRK